MFNDFFRDAQCSASHYQHLFSFFWWWYKHNWNNSQITLLQALWLVICTLLVWSPQLDSKIKSFMNNKTTSVCQLNLKDAFRKLDLYNYIKIIHGSSRIRNTDIIAYSAPQPPNPNVIKRDFNCYSYFLRTDQERNYRSSNLYKHIYMTERQTIWWKEHFKNYKLQKGPALAVTRSCQLPKCKTRWLWTTNSEWSVFELYHYSYWLSRIWNFKPTCHPTIC